MMALLKLQKSKDLKWELNEESDWLININFQPDWALPRPQNEINLFHYLLFTIFKGKAQLGWDAQNIVKTLSSNSRLMHTKITSKWLIRDYMDFLFFKHQKVKEETITGHLDLGCSIYSSGNSRSNQVQFSHLAPAPPPLHWNQQVHHPPLSPAFQQLLFCSSSSFDKSSCPLDSWGSCSCFEVLTLSTRSCIFPRFPGFVQKLHYVSIPHNPEDGIGLWKKYI